MALTEPLIEDPEIGRDVTGAVSPEPRNQSAITACLLKHASTNSFKGLAEHDDDKLMATIVGETGLALSQTFSVLSSLYTVYKKGYPVYAGFGLFMYFALPFIFVQEDMVQKQIDQESLLQVYLMRMSSFKAISCCQKSWKIYSQPLVMKKLTFQECHKSYEKVINMRLQEALLVKSVKHQKFEGMVALVINILIMLDSSTLPSIMLLPAVLNTAKAYAEYDFSSKVVVTMDDGRTPVVAGTIGAFRTQALLIITRLFELFLVVMMTCLAHMSFKQSFHVKFCPIIPMMPLAFLMGTALAAKKDKASFSLAELFAGLFCFSGPLTLPWEVAYVNCKGKSYYTLRSIYLILCAGIATTAVLHDKPNNFTMASLYVAGVCHLLLFALLVAIKLRYAVAQTPPKVLLALIQAVATEQRALPKAWQPFKEVLKRGYGLFSTEEGEPLDADGEDWAEGRTMDHETAVRTPKTVTINVSEKDPESVWKETDWILLKIVGSRPPEGNIAKLIEFIKRNKLSASTSLARDCYLMIEIDTVLQTLSEDDGRLLTLAIRDLPNLKKIKVSIHMTWNWGPLLGQDFQDFYTHLETKTIGFDENIPEVQGPNATKLADFIKRNKKLCSVDIGTTMKAVLCVSEDDRRALMLAVADLPNLKEMPVKICLEEWDQVMDQDFYTHLTLERNEYLEIPEENGAKIVDLIQRNKKLATVDLIDVLTFLSEENGRLLMLAVKKLPNLKEIKLRIPVGKQWKQALDHNVFTHVTLFGSDYLEKGVAEGNCAKITDFIKRNKKLSTVALDSFHLGQLNEDDRGLLAAAVVELSKLTELRIGMKGCIVSCGQIAPFLPRSKGTLTKLVVDSTPWIQQDDVCALSHAIESCRNLKWVELRLAPTGRNMQEALKWLHSGNMLTNFSGLGQGTMNWKPCAKDLREVDKLVLSHSMALGDEDSGRCLGHVLLAVADRVQEVFLDHCSLSADSSTTLVEIIEHSTFPKLIKIHMGRNDFSRGGTALAKFINRCPLLETVILEETSFKANALKQLGEALEESRIKDLDFSNNPSSAEAGEALAKIINKSPGLNKVNLRSKDLSSDALKHLARNLQKTKIKELGLGALGAEQNFVVTNTKLLMTAGAGQALAELLSKMPELEQVALKLTGFNADALKQFGETLEKWSLPELDFSHCCSYRGGRQSLLNIGEAGNSLAQVINKSSGLIKVNLESTGLTADALKQLAEDVQESKASKIKEISLERNNRLLTTAKAGHALAQLINKMPELEKVHWHETGFNAVAMTQLGATVDKWPSKEVELRCDMEFGEAGQRPAPLSTGDAGNGLAQMINKSPKLEKVDVSATGFTAAALKQLADGLQETNIKELVLTGNEKLLASAEAGQALARVFNKSQVLEKVRLGTTGLTTDALQQLADELQQVKVKEIGLPNNNALLSTARAGAALAMLSKKMPELEKICFEESGFNGDALTQLSASLDKWSVKEVNLSHSGNLFSTTKAGRIPCTNRMPVVGDMVVKSSGNPIDNLDFQLALDEVATVLCVNSGGDIHLKNQRGQMTSGDYLYSRNFSYANTAEQALALVISKSPDLIALDLSSTGMTTDSMKQFAEELRQTNLKDISLRRNEKLLNTAEAGAALAMLSKKMPKLEKVKVNGTGFNFDALKQLSATLDRWSVTELDFSDGVRDLFRTREAGGVLGQLINKSQDLVKVMFSNENGFYNRTGFSTAALEELADVLQETKIQELLLSLCSGLLTSGKAGKALAQVFNKSRNLVKVDLLSTSMTMDALKRFSEHVQPTRVKEISLDCEDGRRSPTELGPALAMLFKKMPELKKVILGGFRQDESVIERALQGVECKPEIQW
eukprot:TRINITY_DN7514_c0_g1_i1.p1 TRINITY_DN7514_c0_g1~~TRINITY_DN7514_c0_g1_i1.p1  ORF type:complete len:1844 (-),score=345.22 TRINITY_DN7514_c0_g1_i1:157-5688(-)